MVFFIVLITLCAAASCTKHENPAAHSLRHRSSDRGNHSPKTGRSSSSANHYKRPSPQDVEKDDLVLVLLAHPAERAEKTYPYRTQSIFDELIGLPHDEFEPYEISKPREMDAIEDAYGYSRNPFRATPYHTKDGALNSIYSAYSEANGKFKIYDMVRPKSSELPTYFQYVAEEQEPRPDQNFQNGPVDMTYLSFVEPSLRNTSKVVPQWSLFPEKMEYIIKVLKKNMEMTSPSNVKLKFAVMQQYPPGVHYTLLLTVCWELIDDYVTKGEDAYELNFDETIIQSVNKVTANPQEEAEKIKLKLDKTLESVVPILRYINNVIQSEICFMPVECDTMIDHALIQTSNLRLKLQAILLLATINLADIFMNQHAEDFEQASKEHRGFEYVFNVDSRKLAPLVAAGYTVEMIRKYLTPTDTSAPL